MCNALWCFLFYSIKKYISFNKYLWNTYYVLDTVLGFGAKSVDARDKNPCPLGACILPERVNKIHVQNRSI